MAKKLLIALGVFVALLLVALIALPLLLKDRVVAEVKSAADDKLTVDVSFGDASLSLLSSFPNLTVVLNDVVATGKEPFAGVVLAQLGTVDVTVDLMSIIKGETIKIQSVELLQPKIDLRRLADGTANWDVFKDDGSADKEAPEEKAPKDGPGTELTLKRFVIEDADFSLADAQGGLFVALKDIDHSSSGNFAKQTFLLKTKSSIASVSVGKGGTSYLSGSALKVDLDFDVDQGLDRVTVADNAVQLDSLGLSVTGTVDKVSTGKPVLDLKFNANTPDLRQVLGLVPGLAAGAMKGMKTDGALALSGWAKGVAAGAEQLPAFQVDLTMKDGSWSSAGVPASVTGINITARAAGAGPTADSVVVDVSSAKANLAGNPFSATVHLEKPTTTMDTKLVAKGLIDLDKLAPLIPLEDGSTLSGKVDLDIDFQGSVKKLADGSYRDANAKGRVGLTNVTFRTAASPTPVQLKTAELTFTPSVVELTGLTAQVGRSDLSGSGKIKNLLGYALAGEDLTGQLTTQSKTVDLDELLAVLGGEKNGGGAPDGGQSPGSQDKQAVRVPEGIDMTLNSRVDTLTFNGMTLKTVRGAVAVKDERLDIERLDFAMLDGTIGLAGAYDSKPAQPAMDLGLSLNRVDLKALFDAFDVVESIVPLAATSDGRISTTLQLAGKFDEGMTLVLDSLAGVGDLVAHSLNVNGSEALKMIGDALKNERFQQLKLDGSRIGFEIRDGGVVVKNFPFRIGPIKAGFGGTHQFDGDMAYRMPLEMPTKEFSGQAAGALEGLLKGTPLAGGRVKLPDSIKVDALIGGTIKKPKITLDVQKLGANVGETVKETVKEVAKEAATQVVDTAREEAEKQFDKAKEQADTVRKQAKTAAKAAKDAAYKAADRGVSRTNNPIAKLAAQAAADEAKKQANAAYKKALEKADDEYDKSVRDARKQLDRARVPK